MNLRVSAKKAFGLPGRICRVWYRDRVNATIAEIPDISPLIKLRYGIQNTSGAQRQIYWT